MAVLPLGRRRFRGRGTDATGTTKVLYLNDTDGEAIAQQSVHGQPFGRSDGDVGVAGAVKEQKADDGHLGIPKFIKTHRTG